MFAVILALTQQWLLVSDLHVLPYGGGTEPSYYHSDTNWPLFDSTVAAMRHAAPDARVVVISGDFLAHSFAGLVHKQRPNANATAAAMQVMSRVASSFGRAFPKAQFVIALGNNDDPCGDYRTSPDSRYLAAVAKVWEPLVNRGGAAPDFLRSFSHAGSYTARLPVNGLRAVALDDVYWSVLYRPCPGGRNGRAMQMSWLTNILQRTPPGTRNVLVMHIPPGVDAATTLTAHRFVIVPFLAGDMRARLLDLLAKSSSDVAFAIAGHMHRNGFRIAGGVPLIVVPAISPVYENNPTFLRLEVDERGNPVDEMQYAYSIPDGTWSQILDFDRTYSITSLRAAQLVQAHRRIANDRTVRAQWAASMAGGSYLARDILASWRAYWCAETNFGSAYAACAGDRRRVAALPIALAILAALVVLAIAGAAMLLARQRRTR